MNRRRSVNFVHDPGQRDLEAGVDSPAARECFARRARYCSDAIVAAASQRESLPQWARDVYTAEMARREQVRKGAAAA